jgi:hypothetical protein
MLTDGLPWLNAFIDESGTSTQDSVFACAAVLVDDTQIDAARAAVEAMAQSLASGGEIKSKSIGDNHARRIAFLNAIQEVDFQYACLVVDKLAIRDTSGLRFRRSFNKFFKRLLQQPLRTYAAGGVRAVFDQYGWPETMREFEHYMDGQMQPNLFFDYQSTHVDSLDERLIQLADLIAGSLVWCFDPNRKCSESPQFRELLRPKELSAVCWPPPERLACEIDASEDGDIQRQGLGRVQSLVGRFENSDEQEERAISIILDELLFARTIEEGSRQSIYAEHLPTVLAQHGIEMSTRQVRTLMGAIRDEGVVVAGSPNGYKLALTAADIHEYLAHTESIVQPMLARVARARQSVKLDTSGRYDILDQSIPLRTLVEAATDRPLTALRGDEVSEEVESVLEDGA